MKIMPMGDYYVWHCDWCDSTNYTLWTRFEGHAVTCAACHHKVSNFIDSACAANRESRPVAGGVVRVVRTLAGL